MLKRTHMAFATSCAIAYVTVTSPEQVGLNELLIIGSAVVSAPLPDLDERGVTFAKHRGISHSIWVIMLLAYLTYWAQTAPYPFVAPLSIGFLIGWISHIIGDAFSYAGVAFFYPFQRYVEDGDRWYVSGNRMLFKPMYPVGTKPLGIPATVIWGIIIIAQIIYYIIY